MVDTTEGYRRVLTEALNTTGVPEAYTGPIWDTESMTREFAVIGFMSPFVVVRRQADGVKGTLMFTHSPRLYFRFEPSE